MANTIQFFVGKTISVHFTRTKGTGIQHAGENLLKDLEKVFDKKTVITSVQQAEMIVGLYDQLEEMGILSKKDIACLFDEQDKLKWEAYIIAVKDKKIVIAGTDQRGTIFGIYDFCQRIGISPWYFFADVPIKKKKYFQLKSDFFITQYPSVQYRGIFINDEEELDHWAKAHTKDKTIGPETYVHIFELLLRLRANYIWPAMHVNYFNENPKNGLLASEMGLVVGTSHCDMLLRSNQNEWQPWLKSKGYDTQKINYDYSIPGENRAILKKYWSESVEMNKDYEVSYTVGMRGIHDSGFVTKTIDENTSLSAAEKVIEKKALLEKVISDQRRILKDNLQKEPQEILQTFVPYKEVLKYYDEGLNVPEDITIIWANDNYGYMRRFPSEEDQLRSGGHGLYYHSSYWAATNMHYLFISSTPLARMKNELQKSWDNGIRKIWVLNVGAIKPIEQDIEFFTRFAFEVGKEETTSDVEDFLSGWINANFSQDIGKRTGKLLNEFTQLTNVRKIEQLDSETFSQTAFGDEAARRIGKLKRIYDEVNAIAEYLPKEEKEAFFQLVQMKIHASYYKNAEFYYGDRSVLANKQGKMNAADEYNKRSAEFTTFLRWMLHYYNKIMCNGKWDKILTPELAPPPNMKMYPVTKPALKIDETRLGIQVWQGAANVSQLVFSRFSPNEKWIEVFNHGRGIMKYKIEIPDWIKIREFTGKVHTEERVFIEVIEIEKVIGKKGKMIVTDEFENRIEIPLEVCPDNLESIPERCAIEADGYVSIAAEDFQNKKDKKENKWETVPYLGRSHGNALQSYSPKLTTLVEKYEELPTVSYQLFLTTAGSHLIEFYRLPTLNSVGKIRFGVSIDDFPMEIIESDVTDEYRGTWKQSVLDEVDKLYTYLPFVDAGEHTIHLYMIDSYVVLSKLVLYTKGFVKSSLGPKESLRIGRKKAIGLDLLPYDRQQNQVCLQLYHCEQSAVPLPDILYADRNYYNQEFLAAHLIRKKQNKLASPKSYLRPDGTKNVITNIAAIFSTDQIIQSNGKIAFEAELALGETPNAFTTKSLPFAPSGYWEHLGSPTDGGNGLGMYIKQKEGLLWSDSRQAPGLHYRFMINDPGEYFVWLFLKYDNKGTDGICIGANGTIQPVTEQYSRKGLFSFLNLQIWHWNLISKLELKKGENLFSIYGRTAGVKIDRVYLTKTDELPPLDAEWKSTIF
ncbi:glycosyl hydrolase 115 family protein [Enterococcus songbeiensis]